MQQLTVTALNTAHYKWVLEDGEADSLNLGQKDLEFVDVAGEKVSLNRLAFVFLQLGAVQPENLP